MKGEREGSVMRKGKRDEERTKVRRHSHRARSILPSRSTQEADH